MEVSLITGSDNMIKQARQRMEERWRYAGVEGRSGRLAGNICFFISASNELSGCEASI